MGGGGDADKTWKETMRRNLGFFFCFSGSCVWGGNRGERVRENRGRERYESRERKGREEGVQRGRDAGVKCKTLLISIF